jgi:DNA-binding beta-propeller fold protein YncE
VRLLVVNDTLFRPLFREKGSIMIRICFRALPAIVFLLFFSVGDCAETDYHLLKTIKIGGTGGWDYLTIDSEARRLYITRSDRVMVMDIDAGKIVGEVPKCSGVHGVALDLKRKRGYISNGGDATVSIFDLESLKEISRPKVGQRPDAIMYDPASDRVFSMNAGTKDTTAIDAESGKVVGTMPLGGKPEFAVADEKGLVFVNLEDKDEILVFDSKNLTEKTRYKLDPGKEPSGLAIDRANRRLFASCGNEMMVVLDADSGKVIANLKIGKGTDAAVFDPETKLAFSSNRDNLTVVEEQSPDKFQLVGNVPTKAGARTMALDAKTHNIYLCTADFKPRAPGAKGRPEMLPDTFVVLIVGK